MTICIVEDVCRREKTRYSRSPQAKRSKDIHVITNCGIGTIEAVQWAAEHKLYVSLSQSGSQPASPPPPHPQTSLVDRQHTLRRQNHLLTTPQIQNPRTLPTNRRLHLRHPPPPRPQPPRPPPAHLLRAIVAPHPRARAQPRRRRPPRRRPQQHRPAQPPRVADAVQAVQEGRERQRRLALAEVRGGVGG